MTAVKIYQPAKNAMQSGKGKTHRWALVYERTQGSEKEPLMGWTQSKNTRAQVRLFFPSSKSAIRFAEENGWTYRVTPPHARHFKPKSYADNFLRTPGI